MEGGGEGMVAIVQGLQDAGLAVTVLNCNGKYQGRNMDNKTQASIMAPKDKCLLPAKRSAEMSTQARGTNHMDYQICDDRYLSTYQLAHCNIRPSSSVYGSEFPLQRPEPSKTEGKFFSQSIGQEGNIDVPVRDIQSYRKSCVWSSRGIHSAVSSRVNEEFAESLRRYPVLPEHANSSDYVARLLAHTQAKNTFHNLKKSRLQKDKSIDTFNDIRTKTKNIQTYTRMENTTDKDVKFSYNGKPNKRMRVRSPVNKTIKYKDNQLNETYDYLKSTSHTRYAKATEVRYLEDITRCIKETLQQIMDDRSVECPQIQSRYIKHRRSHHRKTSTQQAVRNTELPNLPTASKILATDPSSHTEPGTYTCPIHHSVCRFCSKPPPCISNILPSTSISPQREAEDFATLEEKQTDKLWKDQIFNWLQDVPVYANIIPEDKEKREIMIEELANVLIKLKNNKNFEAKARQEIIKCLNGLPMWMPSTQSEQLSFRKQISDNLMGLLNNLIKVRSIDAEENLIENDEVTSKDNLRTIKKRFPIDSNANNKESEKITTQDIFKEMPLKISGNKKHTIENLSDQSASSLNDVTGIGVEDEYEKKTLAYIPELSKCSAVDFQENNDLFRNFCEKLQKLQHENVNDVTIQERIQNVIKDWLKCMVKKKNRQLNSKVKQKFSQKSIDKLPNTSKSLFESDINEDYIKQKIRSEGIEDDEEINLQDEIYELLSKEAEKKVIQCNSKTKGQLSNKPVAKMKKISISNYKTTSSSEDNVNEDYLEEVWHWFNNIPELAKGSKSENQKMIQTLATKLQNLRFKEEEDEKVQNKIFNWLSNEAEKNGIKLTSKTKKQLATKLIAKIKKIPAKKCRNGLNKNKTKPRKLWDKINDSNEETDDFFINVDDKTMLPSHDLIDLSSKDIKESIKECLNIILHEYQVPNRDEIETNLTEILYDQMTRNDSENITKRRIYSILRNAEIDDKYSIKISEKLMKTVKELPLSVKSKDSSLLIRMSTLPSEITPIHKQLFQESTERTIVDFIEKNIGNQILPMKNKVKEEAVNFTRKLYNILANPDLSIKEKECTMHDEVSHFLKRLSLPQNDLVVKLIERIENVAYKTSTPRQSKINSNFSFNQKEDSSISAIKFDDRINTQSKEETKYVADLITAIQSWTNEMLIDLNNNKALMNTLILTELAEEIAARQKYLRLHSNTWISEEEELEHLKYMVFRCFNKIIDNDKLLLIMAKVESLMNKIREIYVPQLGRPARPHLNNSNTQIPVYNRSDALNDEISKWVEDNLVSFVSPNVEDKVKDLTHALQHATQNGTKIDSEKVISEWLSSVLKDPNNIKVRCMAEDLSIRLKDKSLKDYTSCAGLSQSSSQFIIENLVGAILDFIKSLPLYQKRNNEDKYIQEKMSAELAISLQKLLSTSLDIQSIDFNMVIVNEIYNYLKKFPMDLVEKEDDSFLLNVAQQLFNYLKSLQLFQDISARNLRTIEEPLMKNVEDWISYSPVDNEISTEKLNSTGLKENSLRPSICSKLVKDAIFHWSKNIPLQIGKTTNDISNALNSFSEQITNMLSMTDAFHDRSKLQRETIKFLKQLPMVDKVDDKYLQNIVKQLINEIKEVTKDIIKPKISKKASDLLYDSIENWCSELPIAGGSAPEEIERVKTLKQNLASKLINKVAALNMNPEIFQDDVLYEDLLQDGIDSLLATLPLSPELESNLAVLEANLIEKIKEAKQKIRDEFAGQIYKKQLRETISKTLPHLDISTPEEQTSFEDLKNSLADAYINLHYVADNYDQKIKYKKKIADEVEKFSNNYLQRHPGTPHNTKKINKDLYKALKKVTVPKDETLRSEVEQVRIRDIINNWIQELPLTEEPAVEKVQRNKKVAVLANRLHEIEKEKELYSELDINNKLEKEISNWLNKLPIRPGEGDVIKMVEKLMKKLKNTEPLRRISASTPRQLIEVDEFDSSQTYNPCSSYNYQNAPPLPASRLTVDDRTHMEKIRQRTIVSLHKDPLTHAYRDAWISPLPIDAANQTEVTKDCPETCPGISSQTQPNTDTSAEESPKIIIKEYFWDANNSKLNESIYRIPCLSNQPSCNISARTSQSYLDKCPRSNSISSKNYFKTPNQKPPCHGPIVTRTPLQEPNFAIQNKLQRPSTQVPQNQSPCVFQHENSYPGPEFCLRQPCSGSLSQIGPNCIANQQCPWPKTNKINTSQEQSYVPLSTPCMPSSTSNMPPNTCISPGIPLCTTPKLRVMKKNDNNVPFRQPRFSLDISEDTSAEHDNPKVRSSRCIHERVRELSPLDNDHYPIPCGRLRANISRGVSEGNSRWTTARLPVNERIYDTPCNRPKIYRPPCNGKVISRSYKEPTMRKICIDRVLTRKTRSRGSHHSNCESCESLRRSKCYGMPCPNTSGF